MQSLKKDSFGRRLKRSLRDNWQLYTFLILPLIWLFLFHYVPMVGNAVAFRRFVPGGSILGDDFVGLHFFRMLQRDITFWRVFRNTVILGVLTLLWTFPAPIILALMFNEVRSMKFKKISQTLSYLPHFLSIVVIVGMIQQLLRSSGPVNNLLYFLGFDRILFLAEPGWFRTIFVTSRVWATAGWGTILYLAALTTIDPTLYEAARVDGAGRWRQLWHITLPGIRPTIVVLLILNVGWVLGVNFEQVLLMQNPVTFSTSDIVSTYLFRLGILSAQFSYAAAIGLFQSFIGLTLLVITNVIAKRLTEDGLW